MKEICFRVNFEALDLLHCVVCISVKVCWYSYCPNSLQIIIYFSPSPSLSPFITIGRYLNNQQQQNLLRSHSQPPAIIPHQLNHYHLLPLIRQWRTDRRKMEEKMKRYQLMSCWLIYSQLLMSCILTIHQAMVALLR